MSKKKKSKAPEAEETAIAEAEVVETETVETPEVATEISEAIEETSKATVELSDVIEETPEEAIDESSETPATEDSSGWRLSQIIEAILFASQKAVSAKELQTILKGAADAEKENLTLLAFAKVKEPALRAAIEELEIACADPARAYEVRENAAGWQLVTKPHFAPWLRQLFPENRSARLSAPAMETLAIIAYRQPITRADIEAVRGVAVDGVMQTILDRGLVKIAGRAEIPGRPLLYETTQFFMEHFGLKDLDDLPNASELRKISLPVAPIPEVIEEKTGEQPAPEAVAETETAAAETEAPAEAAPAEEVAAVVAEEESAVATEAEEPKA